MIDDEVIQANDDALDRFSARALAAYQLPDHLTPWWAIGILDLKPGTLEHSARVVRNEGESQEHRTQPEFWDAWANVLEWAEQRVMQRTMDEWIDLAWNQCDHDTGEGSAITQAVRDAALMSPRNFVQFAQLKDEEGLDVVLKDFHIKTIRAMRNFASPSCILLPYAHGKSYLGSMVVPLMDWAEWRDATEGRVYWHDNHVLKWIRRLMFQIEHNERLQKLFPWIRKPRKGDPCDGTWSTEGFAIGGRTQPDRSFEPLTANQFQVGNRYSRIGADDWVNVKNCRSASLQEQLYEYFFSSVLTFRQQLTRGSRYGTAWPSVYLCGTVFDPIDINYRAYEEFRERGYKALKFDIYPQGDPSRTLWPEKVGVRQAEQLLEEMGPRNFNMRCRNIVRGYGTQAFPLEVVKKAERETAQWCVVPPYTKTIIGFDPGSGKTTRYSANPAFMVYGMQVKDGGNPSVGTLRDRSPGIEAQPEVTHHFIQWSRLEGYTFTRQCDKIVELARYYGAPVAFEDNAIQSVYGDYIRKFAPDVMLISHHTGTNKTDPDQGVEQFEPLFQNGRIIIHTGGAPEYEVRSLRDEFVNWGGKKGKTPCDIVMASWIARFQLALREQFARPAQVTRYAPAYAERFIGGSRR